MHGLKQSPLKLFSGDNKIMPVIPLSQIAERLQCQIYSGPQGDSSLGITGVAGIESATSTELTFLANPKYAPKLKHTAAGAVLVSSPGEGVAAAQLISKNPYLDFARALAMFYQPPRPAPGIHPRAYVAPSARIGDNASIGPFAVVGASVNASARSSYSTRYPRPSSDMVRSASSATVSR